MKTTVEIPDPLLRQVKSYAAAKGLTFREVLESSLRRTIEVRSEGKPFKLKNGSFKGSGSHSELTWEQIKNMIYEGRWRDRG